MTDTINSLKAALWTALFSFFGLFGTTLVGFFQQVSEWASNSGQDPFPDVSVLGYAFVSAIGSAVIGLVNFAIRYGQSKGLIFGKDTVPQYSASLGENDDLLDV